MSLQTNYKQLFGLNDNYTQKELKSSFIKKIYQIDKNQELKPSEKKILIDKYYSQYKLAKSNLLNKNNDKAMILSFEPSRYFENVIKQQQKFFQEFDNILNIMNSNVNNINNNNESNNLFIKSYSQQKVLNPDNTYTVIESSKNNINGKTNEKKVSYKIDSKGNKTIIPLTQAEKTIKN